jgi:ribosomal protein L10
MFEGDWSRGLNAFFQFMKAEKSLSFKFGSLDQALYSESEVIRIAQLPGKNQIVGMIINSMKSPMSKTVYAMKYNTQKLVYILQQKSKV